MSPRFLDACHVYFPKSGIIYFPRVVTQQKPEVPSRNALTYQPVVGSMVGMDVRIPTVTFPICINKGEERRSGLDAGTYLAANAVESHSISTLVFVRIGSQFKLNEDRKDA